LKRYLRLTVHKVVPVVQVKAVLGRAVLVDLEVPMFNNKRKS
jgi:hypothetical protein